MSDGIAATDRTKLKRLPKRGSFDRATINEILDASIVCHLGFCVDGNPFVIPTSYARIGDRIIVHGSAASRMMRTLSGGIEVCLTVTVLDGLVLARSAFHHSVNYRSVIVFGQAEMLTSDAEKLEALRALTDHIVPDRWSEIREPNALELKATTVLSLAITEASAKIRTGGPVDDDEDYELDIWAGTIPVRTVLDDPIDDDRLRAGIPVPEHVKRMIRSER